jgi:hypothetical protein
VIGATQLFGISAFELIYSEDKSRPFGSLVRVTGSLGNPNVFGWIVAQMSIIILLLSTSWWRYAWLFVGALLVVMSGSRTVLILFPFMVAFASVLIGGIRAVLSKAFLLSLGIGSAFVYVVISLGGYFPYLQQLQTVVTSGSLMSVNAFAGRWAMWGQAYAEFASAGDMAWLFGLGSRESTRALDNDFLYVFFRSGTFGLVAHVSLITYIATIFLRTRHSSIGMAGLQYLIFALLMGIVADTLGGWLAPLFLFYLVGIAVGAGHSALSGTNQGKAVFHLGSTPGQPWRVRESPPGH